MISKERLEELIERNATIWHNDWEEIKLDKNTYEVCEARSMSGEHLAWYLCFPYEYDKRKYWEEIDIAELEEDVEKGRWEVEFGCITRTERLELPTWEDLFEQDRVLDCYTQEFAITKKMSVIGVALFGVDFTNKIIEVSIGSDKLFCEELTKENYTLACRKAKELFLGEKE